MNACAAHAYMMTAEAEEVLEFPGIRVPGSYEPPSGCCEQNSGFLKVQELLLIAESFL